MSYPTSSALVMAIKVPHLFLCNHFSSNGTPQPMQPCYMWRGGELFLGKSSAVS